MNKKLNQMREITLSDQIIYKGKIMEVHNYEVKLPSGKTSHREVIRKGHAAAVVAITNDNQIILEEQYRYPYDNIMIELPAGKSEKGEDPLITAKRELEEETGYVAKNMELLCEFYPTVAFTDEIIYIYLATGLEKKQQHLDDGEELEYYTLPLDKATELIKNNTIKDGKTIAGITNYLLKSKLL